jgi:hypothetical protein
MNPLWAAALRRHWPLAGAIFVFVVLAAVDQLWLRPVLGRYDRAVKRAADIGMPVDPTQSAPIVPPRLFALIAENAMPAAVAQEQGASGTLTADLLGDLNTRMRSHGITVVVAEPGPINQQPQSVRVSAHLRLRCRYPQFVALLDDLARGTRLLSVDRFTLTPEGDGAMNAEVWMSRYILKHQKAK